MHVCIYIHTYILQEGGPETMYIYICMYAYVCMVMYIHTHINIHEYIHTCIHTFCRRAALKRVLEIEDADESITKQSAYSKLSHAYVSLIHVCMVCM